MLLLGEGLKLCGNTAVVLVLVAPTATTVSWETNPATKHTDSLTSKETVALRHVNSASRGPKPHRGNVEIQFEHKPFFDDLSEIKRQTQISLISFSSPTFNNLTHHLQPQYQMYKAQRQESNKD